MSEPKRKGVKSSGADKTLKARATSCAQGPADGMNWPPSAARKEGQGTKTAIPVRGISYILIEDMETAQGRAHQPQLLGQEYKQVCDYCCCLDRNANSALPWGTGTAALETGAPESGKEA